MRYLFTYFFFLLPQEEWIDSGGGVRSETDGREEEEDWEREADKLFEWTQGLSYDDIGFASPS